jgi:hypothetical protein
MELDSLEVIRWNSNQLPADNVAHAYAKISLSFNIFMEISESRIVDCMLDNTNVAKLLPCFIIPVLLLSLFCLH